VYIKFIFKASLLFNTFLVVFILNGELTAQNSLIPASHPVYDFLKRMQIEKVIPEYNSSLIPISGGEVAGYLKKIKESKNLSTTDRKIARDYFIEFGYEINKSLENSVSILNKFNGESFFGGKQKYIYSYADSNASLFVNIPFSLSARNLNGDAGKNTASFGELAIGFKGSLYDKVGYSLTYTGGQKFSGDNFSTKYAFENEPLLVSNPKLLTGENHYEYFRGHFRYQTLKNWFSLTVGRENIFAGYGYIDRLFLSGNTAPMDFLKIDLNYKKLNYTFTYGSIKGDSLGVDLKSKNIAFHRLNVKFSDNIKVGYFESVIMNNNPFSFVYFNPISFITSADLNSGAKETTENNTLMGIDFEINPIKNVAIQGTLLVDDVNFATIFKKDISSNDNKFGYQAGAIWSRAFDISNLTFIMEYTRLNPFVYTHRSNKDSYTNLGQSLGHALSPNSDEIAIKFNYDFTNRIKLSLLYQFRRSADGIYYDSLNNRIINYGGNINRGDGDKNIYNTFLSGDRTNRNILTVDMSFEPIKQYVFELIYQYSQNNIIYLSKTEKNSYFRAFLKVFL